MSVAPQGVGNGSVTVAAHPLMLPAWLLRFGKDRTMIVFLNAALQGVAVFIVTRALMIGVIAVLFALGAWVESLP
jgi:hypothetical protein